MLSESGSKIHAVPSSIRSLQIYLGTKRRRPTRQAPSDGLCVVCVGGHVGEYIGIEIKVTRIQIFVLGAA